jgi:hypothetical protein
VKTTAWKVYADYEREEKWLNEMSAMGLAFEDYFLFRYKFSDCKPGEYHYRIELLDNSPGNPASQKYIGFLAENGVEYIANWGRWVYFRKKAEGGPFDIYSDSGSKIKHYKRILAMWTPIICMDLIIGIINLRMGLGHVEGSNFEFLPLNFFVGILLFVLAFLLFFPWNRTRLKLNALKKETLLRE